MTENLILLKEKRRIIENLQNKHENLLYDGIIDFTQDPFTNIIYLLYNSGLLVAIGENFSNEQYMNEFNDSNLTKDIDILWSINLSKNIEIENIEITNNDIWISAQFLSELQGIVCISRNGDIILIDVLSPEDENILGHIDVGIIAAKWSPDYEILVIITANYHILGMTSQWDVLHEISIPSFHINENLPYINLFSNILIEWRSDGEYFTILTKQYINDNKEEMKIYIEVYTRDFEYHSKGLYEDSTEVNDLHHVLSWSKNGSLISSAQTIRKGTQIVFFERNGLRHREFLIENSMNLNYQLFKMDWNMESDLLVIAFIKDNNINDFIIQIYHRNNYHWFLKWEYISDNKNDTILTYLSFDEEKPYRLYIGLNNPIEFRILDFCWDTNISTSCFATAGIIDGTKLKLTPFGKAVVPPPMAGVNYKLNDNIISISFAISKLNSSDNILIDGLWTSSSTLPSSMYDEFCTLTSNNKILFFGPSTINNNNNNNNNELNKDIIESIFIHNYNVPALESILNLDDINLNNNEKLISSNIHGLILLGGTNYNYSSLLFIYYNLLNEEKLIELQFNKNDDKIDIINIIEKELHTSIYRTNHWGLDPSSALIHLDDGSVFRYQIGGNLIPYDEEILEPCPWVKAVNIHSNIKKDLLNNNDNNNNIEENWKIFGLSNRSQLFCGEHQITAGVSSFAINHSHKCIIYTTLGSHPDIRFLPFYSLINWDPLGGGIEELAKLGTFEPRTIERGSKILATIPFSANIVLHLPRGNLEGISPRTLVLSLARNGLNQKSYKLVFQLLRKQRVDLNLIFDHNLEEFLNDIPLILKEIPETSNLNLLLVHLSNEDVTKTKYPTPPWYMKEDDIEISSSQLTTPNELNFDLPGLIFSQNKINENNDIIKINKICMKFRENMMKDEDIPKNYYQPILTSFAKQEPPLIEEALEFIKNQTIKYFNKKNNKKNNNKLEEKKNDNEFLKNIYQNNKINFTNEFTQSLIQYLCFLIDVDIVYDVALGSYDFNMVKAVARKSQKDPREYLPFLEHLQSLPKKVCEYEINVYLKRYEKALQCISEAGDEYFDQCLTLIKEKNLYSLGLELYPREKNEVFHSKILYSLGEYLMSKEQKKYKFALNAFLSCTPPEEEKASEAAWLMNDWRLSLTLLESYEINKKKKNELKLRKKQKEKELEASMNILLQYQNKNKTTTEEKNNNDNNDNNDINKEDEIDENNNDNNNNNKSNLLITKAKEIADTLGGKYGITTKQKLKDSAEIYIKYCNDVENAIENLIKAWEWVEAESLCYEYNREDLIDTDIKQSILYAYSDINENINERKDKYLRAVKRLTVLRDERVKKNDVQVEINIAKKRFQNEEYQYNTDNNIENENKEFNDTSSLFSIESQESMESLISTSESIISDYSTITSSTILDSLDKLFYQDNNDDNESQFSITGKKKKKKINNRRRRKNQLKLKSGTLEEDKHLSGIINKSLPRKEYLLDLSNLLTSLVRFNKLNEAKILQENFISLLKIIYENTPPPPISIFLRLHQEYIRINNIESKHIISESDIQLLELSEKFRWYEFEYNLNKENKIKITSLPMAQKNISLLPIREFPDIGVDINEIDWQFGLNSY